MQVLPYWTKASLSNLAAVVCWRHAASLSPASIRVTQSADGDQDADPQLLTAFQCLRTPATSVPLEVSSQLPETAASTRPQGGIQPCSCLYTTSALPVCHGVQSTLRWLDWEIQPCTCYPYMQSAMLTASADTSTLHVLLVELLRKILACAAIKHVW